MTHDHGYEQWTVSGTKPFTVVLVSDAATSQDSLVGAGRAIAYAPLVPRIQRSNVGSPALGLTLMLARMPTASDDALDSLIISGAINVGVTLALDESQKLELARSANDGQTFEPVFARGVTFSLERPYPGTLLASADAAGAEPSAALHCSLSASDALDVLGAIDGSPSRLAIRGRVSFRTRARPHSITVSGTWTRVYDALAERTDANSGVITASGIAAAVAHLLLLGELTASVDGRPVVPGPDTPDVDSVSAVMLSASRFMLIAHEGTNGSSSDQRFRLGPRPSPFMPLALTKIVSSASTGTASIGAPLDAILGGLLAGLDRARYVTLVAENAGQVMSAPARYTPPASGSRDIPRAAEIAVVAQPGVLRALALALSPDTTAQPKAGALMASGVVRPVLSGARIGHWLADDVVLPIDEGGNEPILLSLPVVEGDGAPVMPDRADHSRFWYAPTFDVVQPLASSDPATSPFLLSFAQTGVTGDAHPEAAIQGTIRLTLRARASDATAAALAGLNNPPALPVPLTGLTVSLELPFTDKTSGTVKTDNFDAHVEVDAGGIVTATVQLLNEWVKLAYGALAYDDFQPQPARVQVTYAYRAYAAATGSPIVPVYGGKISWMIAAHTTGLSRDVPDTGFDPVSLSTRFPLGTLAYAREGPTAINQLGGAAATLTPSRPVAAGALAAPADKPLVIAHAQVALAPAITAGLVQRRYVLRSVLVSESHDLSFPCSTLGGLYRQTGPGRDEVVGCQDALRLGEIRYKQYEEIPSLATTSYRVYRSLQQPGRFMVVPATYRVTRYGPGEPAERAYRPAILVYGEIGADPAANKYVFSATLQPDIPYFARRELVQKLVASTPAKTQPVLMFPTDPLLGASLAPTWTVLAGMSPPQLVQSWDSLQITITTNLGAAATLIAMMEHGGVTGSVVFNLPDGLAVSSTLAFDTQVIGPFERGPVAVDVHGAVATLTNRIEQSVVVRDLALVVGDAPYTTVPVERTLAPGASTSVTVVSGVTDAFALYVPPGGGVKLRELDVFVEDIPAEIVFVNLVNFSNHGLRQLTARCRAKGSTATQSVTLDEAEHKSGSVQISFPITSYLDQRIVQLQVDRLGTDGTSAQTAWLDWDLASQGQTISLTWDPTAGAIAVRPNGNP